MKKSSLLILLLSVFLLKAQAQIDTLNANTGGLIMHNLHEGSSRYLVYRADSASGKIKSADIWERSLQFGSQNDRQVLIFQWKWYRGDSLYRYVRALCDRKNFSPLFQYTRSAKSGILAYKFTGGFLTREDSVSGNRADPAKRVALNPAPFNWEWDMEFFSVLPYKKVGQKFVIAFLDPSDVKSAYRTYEVIGREQLELGPGNKAECWLVKITYMPGAYGKFWISEKTGEMLKMQELYQGTYRYKVRLY
jgi:hypothetical protein